MEKRDVEFGAKKPTSKEKKKFNELRIKTAVICLIGDNMLKNLVLFLLQVDERMKKLEVMQRLRKKLKNYSLTLNPLKLQNPKGYYKGLSKLLRTRAILC